MNTTPRNIQPAWPIAMLLAAVLATLLLARPAGGGINGGGIYYGSIDDFGSIFVNGVEFELAGATITLDDVPATEADLRLGQVVTVDGVVNLDGITGNALSVAARTDLRGTVSAIDAATSSFTLLGQTVRIDGATLYGANLSPSSFAGISVGRTLSVVGHRDAGQTLVATRIDRVAATSAQVVGTVSAFQPTLLRFNIGALVVDYSAAGQIEGEIADGARVEVRGTATSPSVLKASKVEVVRFALGAAGSAASIEDYVTVGLAQGRFTLGRTTVAITPATSFVDGTAADLVAGAKVEAEGLVDADGVVSATQVTLQWPDLARAHGIVTRTPASGGVLEVNGLAIAISSETRVEDRSDQRLSRFRIADIRIGDTVEARGVEPRDARTIRAGLVQRVRPDSRSWIEGVVSSVRAGQIVLLDTPVFVTSSTAYADAAGRRLDAATFFAQAASREVKARGVHTGASLVADQLAFKN